MHNQRIWSGSGAALLVIGLFVLAAGASARGAVIAAPDNSLSTAEYVAAGVPAIDKSWTLSDYQNAAKALEEIAKQDPTKLPRYKSAKSGEMFARLIASEIFSSFTDKKIPVDERVKAAANIAAYLGVFITYANATTAARSLDTELLELGGFVLRMELAVAQTASEFVVAHPESKNNAQSVAGFKQMREGFGQTTGGVIEMMTDAASVRPSEATRFAGELKGYLPKLYAELLPEAQERVKTQLKQAVEKVPDKDLKDALTDLLGAVK